MAPTFITTSEPGSPGAAVNNDLVTHLQRASRELAANGIPVPPLRGKLLRPQVALALVPPALRPRLDKRFWHGALALQMVHEASLLHDDILDDAAERRGHATLVAESGISAALVLGDHYLTAAYRVAAGAGAPTYLEQFIIAVERTVAGEIAQGRSAGRVLSLAEYRQLIAGKSGELFGAAALLGGALFDLGRGDARVRLGRELGALYQQVDDLLDYCPCAGTGKPPLQDYRQHKWTWMMDLAGLDRFGESEAEVVEVLFRPTTDGVSPARRAVTELRRQQERLLRRVRVLSPGDAVLRELLSGWVRAAESAVRTQTDALLAAV